MSRSLATVPLPIPSHLLPVLPARLWKTRLAPLRAGSSGSEPHATGDPAPGEGAVPAKKVVRPVGEPDRVLPLLDLAVEEGMRPCGEVCHDPPPRGFAVEEGIGTVSGPLLCVAI